MTRLAVVAYPALSADDHRWIEGIRARHDPLALRIAAHFTLVFPTEVAEAPVLAEIRNTLRFTESIPVLLRRAAASPDAIAGGYYVWLLAEEGEPELLALHEALYDGILAAHRRRDIAFVPTSPPRCELERILAHGKRRLCRKESAHEDVHVYLRGRDWKQK